MEPLLQAPLLGHTTRLAGDAAGSAERAELQRRIALGVYLSLAANLVLLVAKSFAYAFTGSMAVAASMVDSLIDLASQALIALADRAMSRKSQKYPAGRSRLEPLSVLGCAYIMTVGGLAVIRESSVQLYGGFARGELPRIEMSPAMYALLGCATALKLALWAYCFALRAHSGALLALAEDHINDVASNTAAIATAAAASLDRRLWWADPAGGVAISLYIIASWARITVHQVRKIVGRAAPEDFVAQLARFAAEHHVRCEVAYLRAFHAGQRYQVDVELLGPAGMTVAEASGVALELKAKLEALPEVESAAVVVLHSPLPRSASEPIVLPRAHADGGGALAVAAVTAGAHKRLLSGGDALFAFDGDVEAGPASEGRRSPEPVFAPGAGAEAAAGDGGVLGSELPPGSLAHQLAWCRQLRDAPGASFSRARRTPASP